MSRTINLNKIIYCYCMFLRSAHVDVAAHINTKADTTHHPTWSMLAIIALSLFWVKRNVYNVMWRWTWSNGSGSGGCNSNNKSNATATATGNRRNHVQTTARACNKKQKSKSLPLSRICFCLFGGFCYWLRLIFFLYVCIFWFVIIFARSIPIITVHLLSCRTCDEVTVAFVRQISHMYMWNAFDFTCCCFVFSSFFRRQQIDKNNNRAKR